MVEYFAKKVLVDGVILSIKELYKEIKNSKVNQEKRERLSDALASIQIATIKTKNFIDNNGYKPNMNIAELWTVALNKSIKAGIKDLPEYLYHKAKFWGEPQDWLNEPTSMELVPKLKYLRDQCDMILVELQK